MTFAPDTLSTAASSRSAIEAGAYGKRRPRVAFRDGLIAARSHIAMIVGLIAGFGLICTLDPMAHPATGGGMGRLDQTDELIAAQATLPLAQHAALRPDQLVWGQIAWRYFEQNIDAATGLSNAANQYPSTTMWDTGSFLLGMISAERLGIIDRATFDRDLSKALGSLAVLPLFDGVLPNKAYNTHTLLKVDYNNQPSDRGIGWSALDVARVLIPLTVIERDYPEHAGEVTRITQRWDLSKVVRGGLLIGGGVGPDGNTEFHQEGRVGYEQYAAKALILMGFDAYQAFRTDRTITYVKVDGEQIPVDSRSADKFDAQVYSTTEPFMLDGIELGFDERSRKLSEQIYLAQAARFEHTGIPTAVSEGHLDKAPNFAYSTVYGNGVAWAVLTDTGARVDQMRTLSTKTVFSLDALYNTPYTAKLLPLALTLNDPAIGWLEGRYEIDGTPDSVATANTNGIILEGLHYRVFGQLLHHAGK